MLYYDCEIINMIPGKKEEYLKGYKYCNGWTDYKNMGVSVIGMAHGSGIEACVNLPMQILKTIDFTDANYKVFCGWDRFMEKIAWYSREGGGGICGFNSISFDDKLMSANGIKVSTSFDLLREVRIAAFGSPHWYDCPKGTTYKLEALAAANKMMKTGSGELAPKLWQDGKYKEVIDYCINDVILTVELHQMFTKGRLVDPNTGNKLSTTAPSF